MLENQPDNIDLPDENPLQPLTLPFSKVAGRKICSRRYYNNAARLRTLFSSLGLFITVEL